MGSRLGLTVAIAALVVGVAAAPAAAKDGENVSVVINGDGGPTGDSAALKASAAAMLCLSYPEAKTAKVAIKGQSGSKKVKCSKVRGDTAGSGGGEGALSEADGTRKDPIPIGESAEIGDGWTLKVVNVAADANGIVQAENQFNDPPAPGRVFFLVGIEATYNGDEPTSTFTGSVSLNVVDSGNVSYSSDDYCGVIPGEVGFEDVFQGGTVAGNECWSVDASKTASLIMYARTSFGSGDPVFFALS